jgi:hypothetical protein
MAYQSYLLRNALGDYRLLPGESADAMVMAAINNEDYLTIATLWQYITPRSYSSILRNAGPALGLFCTLLDKAYIPEAELFLDGSKEEIRTLVYSGLFDRLPEIDKGFVLAELIARSDFMRLHTLISCGVDANVLCSVDKDGQYLKVTLLHILVLFDQRDEDITKLVVFNVNDNTASDGSLAFDWALELNYPLTLLLGFFEAL